MAETKYTYSVENDFPNQQIDIDKLTIEIGESAITTEFSHIIVRLGQDSCDIYFTDALTSSEETTLNGLVSVHDGVPLENINSQVSIGTKPKIGDLVWIDSATNIVYRYDNVRASWLSSNREYPIFSKKGKASGMYLSLASDFSVYSIETGAISTISSLEEAYMTGKSATIVGIFCRSKSGTNNMKFALKKNGETILDFEYDGSGNFIYSNNELNLELSAYDEIQLYVYKFGRGVRNTVCRLEISWRYEE